jgi:hypothetical protein
MYDNYLQGRVTLDAPVVRGIIIYTAKNDRYKY